LGAAQEFIQKEGFKKIVQHGKKLTEIIIEKLAGSKGVELYLPSTGEEQMPTVAFNIIGLDPGEAGFILESSFGIEVRSGLHCAPLAHRTLGTFPQGTIRVSPGYFNTLEDIQVLVKAVGELVRRKNRF